MQVGNEVTRHKILDEFKIQPDANNEHRVSSPLAPERFPVGNIMFRIFIGFFDPILFILPGNHNL